MKEWVCREISTTTKDVKNGILTRETELIRCKNCKYFDGYYCNSEDLNLCLEPEGFSGALFCPPEDFYCAHAKGKE